MELKLDIGDIVGLGQHDRGGRGDGLPGAVLQILEALVESGAVQGSNTQSGGFNGETQPCRKLRQTASIGCQLNNQRRDAVDHQSAVNDGLGAQHVRITSPAPRARRCWSPPAWMLSAVSPLWLKSVECHLNRNRHRAGLEQNGIKDKVIAAIGHSRQPQGLDGQQTGIGRRGQRDATSKVSACVQQRRDPIHRRWSDHPEY